MYGVTKTTLCGLTKGLAKSLVHKNIRVNCIAPGVINTEFASPVGVQVHCISFYYYPTQKVIIYRCWKEPRKRI